MKYGLAGYTIVRETEAEASKEFEHITDVRQSSAESYGNYQQWLGGTKLEHPISRSIYLHQPVQIPHPIRNPHPVRKTHPIK